MCNVVRMVETIRGRMPGKDASSPHLEVMAAQGEVAAAFFAADLEDGKESMTSLSGRCSSNSSGVIVRIGLGGVLN